MNFLKQSSSKSTAGFLTVEVLVAISIMVAVLLAALYVADRSLKVSRRALHSTQAAFLLEEGAEAARILRDNNWNNISGLNTATTYYPVFSGGTWTFSATPTTVGQFTRTINIANVARDAVSGDIAVSGVDDPDTKLITVTVSWNDGGDTVTKTIQFYILDIFS